MSLECRPAVELVEAYGGDRGNLLYVDPPYIVDKGIRRGGEYRVEMRSNAVHRELLESCLSCDAAVVVSGYGSELYDGMLGDWYRWEIPMTTSQGSGDGRRTEVVWSNRRLEGLGGGSHFVTEVESGDEMARCLGCAAVLRQPRRGRRKVWCSAACRTAAWRVRRDVEGDVEVEDDEVAG
ncbi:hypothetical protein [Mycobacteroides abscessus]|uniref:hypothetical protein n=1 Tax=Mycobacteroides abscessus TaxID=36809 RepID=UPI0027DE5CD2|nr:hypothetical protein [Mycobacteroides abscessus]